LILFDLDSFKSVNDRYGHAVGDQVLCEIARRITAHAPPDSCTARLGGDEFVVLLTPATLPREDLLNCARRIRDHVAAPITVADARLRVTTSAGAAILPIEHADQLLSAADKAMYRAKRTAYGLIGPDLAERLRFAGHTAERGDVGR
jgi:diguanylate cyclase (GGDEF)-like protein